MEDRLTAEETRYLNERFEGVHKDLSAIREGIVRIETTIALKVKEADGTHAAIEQACAGRHLANKARIVRLEKGVLGALLAVVGAVGTLAWSKLTGKP